MNDENGRDNPFLKRSKDLDGALPIARVHSNLRRARASAEKSGVSGALDALDDAMGSIKSWFVTQYPEYVVDDKGNIVDGINISCPYPTDQANVIIRAAKELDIPLDTLDAGEVFTRGNDAITVPEGHVYIGLHSMTIGQVTAFWSKVKEIEEKGRG